MELTEVLASAISTDARIRVQAEGWLRSAEEENYGHLVSALVVELANESKPIAVRQMAGLHLKNLIVAQDTGLHQDKLQRWYNTAQDAKAQVRNGLLHTLGSAFPQVRTTAAQAIAGFGAADLAMNDWADLLDNLLACVTGPTVPEPMKVAALQTLGYLCEELNPEFVSPAHTNSILTAIVDGMQPTRSLEMQVAAVKAMKNSLEFAEHNFENADERNMIMQVICQATQTEGDAAVTVRQGAFECIATIAATYYEKLPAYMDVLYQLTTTAISSDNPIVGMQAIEFWSSICEEEIELVEILQDDPSAAQSPDIIYLRILEQAAPGVVAILLDTLPRQSADGDDEDDWNIAMAGATCLSLIAQVIQDQIVPLVIPYVTSNVQSENWHQREAALMAFGSIMEGPSPESMAEYVVGSLTVLLNCLQDPVELVKDTAAWTLARICDCHSESLPSEAFPVLVQALHTSLNDSPKVAAQACFAIYNLAGAVVTGEDVQTNALSGVLEVLIGKLFEVTVRNDNDEHNLRASAYESINKLVEHSAVDMQQVVGAVMTEAMTRLEATLSGRQDGDGVMNLQVLLCGLIYQCVQKLNQGIEPVADRLMGLFLQVLNVRALEDAIMVIGQIADKLGESFERYMKAFNPLLIQALGSVQEYQICIAGIGVVGDLCRALEAGIAEYSDDWMAALLLLLRSPELNRSAKPLAVAVFADVAMALNGQFARYTQAVMEMLQQASTSVIEPEADEEVVDNINSLRESILEAYTGILHGLQEGKQLNLVAPFLDGLARFIHLVATDEHSSSDVKKALIGLIGDIGQCFQKQAAGLLHQQYVTELLTSSMRDENCVQLARWVHQIISQLR